jgi:hypothetical protein
VATASVDVAPGWTTATVAIGPGPGPVVVAGTVWSGLEGVGVVLGVGEGCVVTVGRRLSGEGMAVAALVGVTTGVASSGVAALVLVGDGV